jgi:hypothetical protein
MLECRHRRFPGGVILLRVCRYCKCGVLCRDPDEMCASAVSRPIQSSVFAGFGTPRPPERVSPSESNPLIDATAKYNATIARLHASLD